jgi:hypothetical protein
MEHLISAQQDLIERRKGGGSVRVPGLGRRLGPLGSAGGSVPVLGGGFAGGICGAREDGGHPGRVRPARSPAAARVPES